MRPNPWLRLRPPRRGRTLLSQDGCACCGALTGDMCVCATRDGLGIYLCTHCLLRCSGAYNREPCHAP